MMPFALLALVLQVKATALSAAPQRDGQAMTADSARDLSHAHSAQSGFERSRRALLPIGSSGGGRCDVRLGRFCWWYDGATPVFPPENETLSRRREELLETLDAAGAKYPGDDWLAGMRVHYRIDAKAFASADSVARTCRATGWWCAALNGYAAHAGGNDSRADSSFAAAIAAMPVDVACKWRDITQLLSDADHDRYEREQCESRMPLEARYWALSRPTLSSAGNEWQGEFNSRRVVNWLGERSATPHLLGWGEDAAELVLRYGWPVAWSQVPTSSVGATEPSVIGHDPSPSFAFAPVGWASDTAVALAAAAWDLDAPRAAARFAPRSVRRVGKLSAQVARFRRGDSTLVVAAYSAVDDSLRVVSATLGAATLGTSPASSTPDTARAGRARVLVEGVPWLAGVDIADTSTRTLALLRLRRAAGSGFPTCSSTAPARNPRPHSTRPSRAPSRVTPRRGTSRLDCSGRPTDS